MKKLGLIVFAVTVCTVSYAQVASGTGSDAQRATEAKIASARAQNVNPELTNCAFTFSSGSGDTSIKYCVTSNGNIAQFEAPQGHPMVSQANHAEGYSICDLGTETMLTEPVGYGDFGGLGDTGNWAPATVVSHNAKSVKITRTTRDGLWTLTQTISLAGGVAPGAKIAMAITNNSSVTKTAVLARYTDLDADGIAVNTFDGTVNSAAGWNNSSTDRPFGLVLQDLGNEIFHLGLPRMVASAPDPCDVSRDQVEGVKTNTDGSLLLPYAPTVQPHHTATVNLIYKGW